MPAHFDLMWRAPALRPVAPLVLAAWEDGNLTPAELLEIREALERSPFLDDETRIALRAFLDPEQPPSPDLLHALDREVRSWLGTLPEGRRAGFAELGAALAEHALGPTSANVTRELIEPLELGLAPRRLSAMHGAKRPARAVTVARSPELRAALDGAHAATRDEVRTFLADPQFRFVSNLSTHEYREQVLRWCRALSGLPMFARVGRELSSDDARDLGEFVSAFETLAYFDLSLVVKFGVQFGLFGGAIEALGTHEHRELLPQVMRCELLGCFAMTERAHGSNVRDLETVARYEPASREFVIDTPSLSAGKEWIGNAALHARMAVVFAQLETHGERYGVHAFLVPLRDAAGNLLPGVRAEDCGEKMGLNGVDNGRLWFQSVRVPRGALLDRFGQVAEDGAYTSSIPGESKRFFTMLGTLVSGRISVAGAALSASKVGLAIALRYGQMRRQFPDSQGEERPLLDYLTHQRRLVPRLAAACAYSFAQNALVQRFSESRGDEHKARDVEALAAGIKALGTWQAIDALQQCRECCGGQGYLTSNRIDALRTDTDVFATFEGDNTVLMQLVAKELLARFRRDLKQRPLRTLTRTLLENVEDTLLQKGPLSSHRHDREALLSPDFQAEVLGFRERSLLSSLLRRIQRRISEGMDPQEAFEACQDHAIALTRAHVESFVLARFQEGCRGDARLTDFCSLYGLWRIEADAAWLLESGYLVPEQSRAIRTLLNERVAELREEALALVEAFAIPASCLGPLADPEYLRASGLTIDPQRRQLAT
jgi:acyl-CoA oxidase